METLAKITANLSSLIRAENKNGIDYLVSPVILLTEGVHNNILYTAEELAKFPEAWNGRPLPLFHPTVNDRPVTANSPEMIEKHSVGQVFNCRFEAAADRSPARIVGEAWIDTAKLNHLAENGNDHAALLIKMLDEDSEIEVSTGLFTDDEIKNGKWNDGSQYIAVARNHRPDHLAILPGGKGACSCEDGCGLPRTNEDEETTVTGIIQRVTNLLSRLASNQPKGNELTKHDMKGALDTALRQKLSVKPGQFISIEDFSSDFVVYHFFDESTGKSVLYKRPFTTSATDQITLGDTDEMVTRRTEYIPQAPQVPVVNSSDNEEGDVMDEKVETLIANESNEFTADDKPALLKLNEAVIDGMLKDNACGCGEGEPAPVEAPAPAPKANDDEAAPAAALTRDDVAAIVSDTMKAALPELITNAVSAQREQDASAPIIARLTNNANCKIGEEALKAMSAETLAELEQSLNPGIYSGRGSVRTNDGGEGSEFTAPEMPALFEPKA
jgi:hypothetical protein